LTPEEDSHVADATFETYYAPGLGVKYAVRAWIVSAVILAIGVAITWSTFMGNPQWWVLVGGVLIFGFPLAMTVSAAVMAPSQWGADGRLAVRLDDSGMTLPGYGTVAWDEIASIAVIESGFVQGNALHRAWEKLIGSPTKRFVRVRLKDAAAVLARVGVAPTPIKGVDLNELHQFQGVWGEGLRSPGWDETVAALRQGAVNHGVELPVGITN
jgi:hypothetical protein